MQVPLEITFRNVPKSSALEALVREKAAQLERVCSHIISCRVALEKPHAFQETGTPYRVRLLMTVPPNHEIVVTRNPGEGDFHDDLPAVVRSAFEAARRQLKELVERQRGEIKSHPQQQVQAFVIRLFRTEGYGFLKNFNGQEIYFQRQCVVGDEFDRLRIGTGVSYQAITGERGLQATTVQIVDKPGSRASEKPTLPPPLGWRS